MSIPKNSHASPLRHDYLLLFGLGMCFAANRLSDLFFGLISFAIIIAGFCIVTYSKSPKSPNSILYYNYVYLIFDDNRDVKHSVVGLEWRGRTVQPKPDFDSNPPLLPGSWLNVFDEFSILTEILLVITCVLVLSTVLVAAPERPEGKPLFAFAADVHRANLMVFKRGLFHFELVQGITSSFDDVNRLQMKNTVSWKGSYAFDGQDAVLECLVSDEVLVANTVKVSGTESRSLPFCHRVLTDGKVTCIEQRYAIGDKVDRRVMVEPDREGTLFNGHFQFNYWVGEPAVQSSRLLEDVAREMNGIVSLADCKMTDSGSALITIRSGKSLRVYDLDLEHGGVPRSIKDYGESGDVLLDVTYSELKKIENGGWFPMTRVVLMPEAKIARVCRITSHDCIGKIPPDTFVLRFAESVNVSDNSTQSFLKNVTSLDLHHRRSQSSKPYSTRPLSTRQIEALPEMPGETQTRGWLKPTVVLAGLLLIGAVLWVAKKRIL